MTALTIMFNLRYVLESTHRWNGGFSGDLVPGLLGISNIRRGNIGLKELDRKFHEFAYTKSEYPKFNDIIPMQPIRALGS